ncbi:MAG: hypothetical protein M1830_010806 [Pleopsidium flavum]|nr:MAG: hypothetical protein M1830_010806 [Pleopsidium flavum]
MSGIPIYTASPITATKATGITSQTTAPQVQATSAAPASNSATPTASASFSTGHQSHHGAAAPASAPAPAPTGSVSRPTQQSVATPTRTFMTPEYDGPPRPQPGATPSPFTATNSAKATVPPPPKTGEIPKPPEYYTPVRAPAPTSVPPSQPYPPQMAIPPPASQSFRQTPSSTSTTMNAPSSYPVSNPAFGTQLQNQQPPTRIAPVAGEGIDVEGRRTSLEHPPGYSQNPYATEMTPDQRFANQQSNTSNQSNALGYAGYRPSNGGFAEEEGASYWDTAKKWAKLAGDKASEVESDVWRRINKE